MKIEIKHRTRPLRADRSHMGPRVAPY